MRLRLKRIRITRDEFTDLFRPRDDGFARLYYQHGLPKDAELFSVTIENGYVIAVFHSNAFPSVNIDWGITEHCWNEGLCFVEPKPPENFYPAS